MKRPRTAVFATGALLAVTLALPALGDDARPPVLREVGIDQKLGESLPLDLSFRDESGDAVRLGDFFGRKPVLLVLAYYRCPMLCPMALEGLVRSLRPLSLDVGREFQALTVSIDPRDTPEAAAEEKRKLVAAYGRAGAAQGWRLLVGDAAAIEQLTQAIGFHYRYDAQNDQYAHATALFVLTLQGKISRVLYGVDPAPRDVRLALVEASDNRIGTLADQLLLFCYHYDPLSGKYGAATMTALRLAGAMTLLGLAGFVVLQLRRENLKPQV